jgi:hypothetical protein
MNRHQRRTAAAQTRNKDTPPQWLDLPLVQFKGAAGETVTLSPNGLRDYFTACAIEHAHQHPIDELVFERLARALRIQITDTFRHLIHATIIGTTLVVVHRRYSQRGLLQLLRNLKRNPLRTIEKTRDDPLAEFVIKTIQQDVETTGKSEREVIDQHATPVRGVIPRGRPNEEARSAFFKTIVEIARAYKDSLELPQRDESRGTTVTPLYEFGDGMCDLIVDYGNAMLELWQLPPGRFDGFTKLGRAQLIHRLETARRRIS